MAVRYRIKSISEHGGFWVGGRVCDCFETTDAAKAEEYEKRGYPVEKIGASEPEKSEKPEKTSKGTAKAKK